MVGFAVVTLAAAGENPALQVLVKRCWTCHGAAHMANLDLRDRAGALRGGGRGPAIVPGKPDESLLFLAVSGKHDLKMPPGKETLGADEVAALRTWIASGAEWSATAATQAAPSHWSFRKPVRPAVPAGASHPIDAFVQAGLAAKGLTVAPRASREQLIRRAYFDLIGLPPAPGKVDAFVADSSLEAWAKLIDELLQSPQYGERWARHWLDVVRYADSGGYETDIYFKNAWRYRDYVVKAFNDDKPYDRFVQEQIAGDEIWPGNLDLSGTYDLPKERVQSLEARIATGLYTFGPEVHESNMDAEKLQYEKLTDWVDTTSSAFLGLTFGCARCHDHKFDRITQRDYYRLAAVFAYSTETEVPVVHRMSIRDHGQYYPRIVAVAEARAAYRLHEDTARKRLIAERKKPFSPEEVAAYETEEEKRTPVQRELAAKVAAAIAGIKLDKDLTPEEAQRSASLKEAIGKAVLEVPERDAQKTAWDGLMEIPTASVLGHLDPALVPATHLYSRGELSLKKERVAAGLPAFLGGGDIVSGDCSGPRCVPLARKQLALWLTEPDHPLTARVMVNRVWAWHFGRGLAATPNDFGRQGQAPVLPELLDWLSTEFTARKWSVKEMHRLIMTSETYQRSSAFHNEKNLSGDRDNVYHWRANRRRLEGEALWDAMHSVAGTLNPKMGGKPVVPPLSPDEAGGGTMWQWPVNGDPAEFNRRGLYLLVRRNFPYPMFEAFDNPINSISCPQRDVSSVAPQALWFLNNRIASEQAAKLAARLRTEFGSQPESWVEGAWRLALGRGPSPAEKLEGVQLMSRLSLEKFCLSLFNLNEFAFVD